MIINLEGLDACGKGTQAERLVKRLGAKLYKFPNRETVSGELLYEHLAYNWAAELAPVVAPEAPILKYGDLLDPLVFQALQLANRMEVAGEIFQAASRGDVVFDRYWPSGYAYGKADGLDGEYLIKLHSWLPQPDLHILLDVDLETSRVRRPERRDRYESQGALLETVIANYRELWARMGQQTPLRWVVVDARQTVEDVEAAVGRAVVALRSARAA